MPVLSKPIVGSFVVSMVAIAVGIRQKGYKLSTAVTDEQNKLFVQKGRGRAERVGIDGVFVKRMKKLLGIIMPGVFSVEFGYAVAVAILMVIRTWCDVWMIQMTTSIESAIISMDRNQFVNKLSNFALYLFPIACVNNALKYSLAELNLRFRTNLTQYLMKTYLKGYTYYKITNIDNRITNADQLLTQDVERFCKSVTDLYSNLSKPVLDMVLYSYRLSTTIGMQGPGNMVGYLLVSGAFLNWLRRPVGRFTVNEQRLEGEYRHVHSRVIVASEEVAFYNGNEREKWIIEQVFDGLIRHLRNAQRFRYSLGVVDTVVAKYIATVVGFYVVSRPFLGYVSQEGLHVNDRAALIEDYYSSGRMLLRMAQAVGRLVLAGREMTRLAGFTARVHQLMEVLEDLNNGKYTRTMVADSKTPSATTGESVSVAQMRGELVHADDVIRFEDVPLKTPNNDTLVEKLNFEVQRGMNVLVCGPNGCGKSSMFRVLGGLWPLFGGKLTKPQEKMFYIPQRPYLTLGTLRDQVIYPHSQTDMIKAGYTDDDLLKLLADVQLGHLVQREGGWDAVQDWADVLSGGEKQRVAMARVFYHRPAFAVLDECTSAVSVDVEGYMYTRCREERITLFTVSHRRSLWKYHDYILEFDGQGGYSFRDKENGEEGFGS